MGDPNDKGLDQRDYTQRHSRSLTVTMPARAGAVKPRLLDQVRLAIRTRHFNTHTKQAYIAWIKVGLSRNKSLQGCCDRSAFCDKRAMDGFLTNLSEKQDNSGILDEYAG